MTEIESYLSRFYDLENVLAWKDFGDGEYAAVVRMGFNDRIIYGSIDSPCYDRHWCFDPGRAKSALDQWHDRTAEPQGWKKNYRGQYSDEFLRQHPHMAEA